MKDGKFSHISEDNEANEREKISFEWSFSSLDHSNFKSTQIQEKTRDVYRNKNIPVMKLPTALFYSRDAKNVRLNNNKKGYD